MIGGKGMGSLQIGLCEKLKLTGYNLRRSLERFSLDFKDWKF